jgi:hypothetical protein
MYKDKVIKSMKDSKPGIYEVEVQHDDWCTIWKTGVCDCNPHVAKRGLK